MGKTRNCNEPNPKPKFIFGISEVVDLRNIVSCGFSTSITCYQELTRNYVYPQHVSPADATDPEAPVVILPRKKVWTHLGKKLFSHLVNQRMMAIVVVTLIVAFLLAMPPQLCIRKAIHNDFSIRRRWSSQRYSSQLFTDFRSL